MLLTTEVSTSISVHYTTESFRSLQVGAEMQESPHTKNKDKNRRTDSEKQGKNREEDNADEERLVKK